MSGRIVPRVVQQARVIAAQAHAGQVDKAGKPYLTHPARVAYAVRAAGGGAEAEAAAWLHDVLEDTTVTAEHLLAVDIPPAVVEAVIALTGRRGEPYEDKVLRAKANPISRIVKRADISDNADPERLALLDHVTAARLRAKYARGKALLDS